MDRARTYVYAADISPLIADDIFAAAYASVPQIRRDKVDRLALVNDKRLSLGAGLLLHYCLTEGGIESYSVACGAQGKPFLTDVRFVDGRDAGNFALCFNLSHSGSRVMCAVSTDSVGCDVELIRDFSPAVAKRFLDPSAYNDLMSIGSFGERNAEFFRLWTRREALAKVCGLGLAKLGELRDADRYYFKEYGPYDGYRYAVCGLAKEFDDGIRFVDLRHAVAELAK